MQVRGGETGRLEMDFSWAGKQNAKEETEKEKTDI